MMAVVASIPYRELTTLSLVLRVVLAIVMGGVIGLERGLKNRPAGLRTYMLVCLGACIVMVTNQYSFDQVGGDPMRLGAQVISGIGFLGAGTIIVTMGSQIKGLTTAAGLWASACVGLALGAGLFEVGVLAGICIFIILTPLQILDMRLRKGTRVVEVYVELERTTPVRSFLSFIKKKGIEASNLQMQNDNASHVDLIAFIVTLRGPKNTNHAEIMKVAKSMEGVSYVEEL